MWDLNSPPLCSVYSIYNLTNTSVSRLEPQGNDAAPVRRLYDAALVRRPDTLDDATQVRRFELQSAIHTCTLDPHLALVTPSLGTCDLVENHDPQPLQQTPTKGDPRVTALILSIKHMALQSDHENAHALERTKNLKSITNTRHDSQSPHDDYFIIDSAASVSCSTKLSLLHPDLSLFNSDELISILGINGDKQLTSPGMGNIKGEFSSTQALYVPGAVANIL